MKYNKSLDSDSVPNIESLLSCSGPNQYPESFTGVNGNSVDNYFIFHISFRKILSVLPKTHTFNRRISLDIRYPSIFQVDANDIVLLHSHRSKIQTAA